MTTHSSRPLNKFEIPSSSSFICTFYLLKKRVTTSVSVKLFLLQPRRQVFKLLFIPATFKKHAPWVNRVSGGCGQHFVN